MTEEEIQRLLIMLEDADFNSAMARRFRKSIIRRCVLWGLTSDTPYRSTIIKENKARVLEAVKVFSAPPLAMPCLYCDHHAIHEHVLQEDGQWYCYGDGCQGICYERYPDLARKNITYIWRCVLLTDLPFERKEEFIGTVHER